MGTFPKSTFLPMVTKVVVTGPVCAGKTTFVRSLSESNSISTEAPTTNLLEKTETTVGLDVGTTRIDGQNVRLIGTPGQKRFEYMWDILVSGADGFVLLIPADQRDALEKTLMITTYLKGPPHSPIAIGITRTDLAERPMYPVVKQRLGSLGLFVEQLDVRTPEDCQTVLTRLLHEIDP